MSFHCYCTGPDEEHQFDKPELSEEPGRIQPGAGEWERDGSVTTCVQIMCYSDICTQVRHFISFHIFLYVLFSFMYECKRNHTLSADAILFVLHKQFY